MDFKFTEAQEMLRSVAEQFAVNELEPLAAEIDRTAKFPAENYAKMVETGFAGIGIDESLGGSGGGTIEKVIVVEEFAKKCMASSSIISIHMMAPWAINKFGTPEQKELFIPKITSGGGLSAFALTEPGAGTDAAAVKTTAIYDEKTDEYVLNGTKCFISGGGLADVLIIFALTDPEKALRGMSAFIVEKGTPGFSIGKIEEKMGISASETAELIFEDCRIPKANLLGEENKGFKIAMMTLDGARIGAAAQALGLAEGAIDLSIKYMHERIQFGKPIANLQVLQFYLADMATKTRAAKLLVYEAAWKQDNGLPYSMEAAMAKANASENARFVTNLALQIHGGYGYMKDYPLERMYRDAKITEIYEGTSEVNKIVISRALLG